MKVSPKTEKMIQELNFDPNAKIIFCAIPLGSIFWTDEIPYENFLARGEDKEQILKIFAIRISYWNNEKISFEDSILWEEAKSKFPRWPIFCRLELTPCERKIHEDTQNETEHIFDFLISNADMVNLTENNGVTSFTAVFDLEKEDNKDKEQKKLKWW